MICRILVALMLLSVSEAFCQQNNILTGKITLYKRGNEPLYNIMVSANDATSAPTNSVGGYTLEFQHKGPGEAVALSVEKQNGWVMVDESKKKQYIRSNPFEEADEIQLCRLKDLEEARLSANLISKSRPSQELIRTQKEAIDLIKELKQKGEIDTERYKKLEKTLHELSFKIEVMRRGYDSISAQAQDNIGNQHPLYTQAIQTVKDQDLEAALNILKDQSLKDILHQAELSKDPIKLDQAINLYVLKGTFFITKLDLLKARECLFKAYEADPENIKLLMQLGNLAVLENNLSNAKYLFKKSMSTTKNVEIQAYAAMSLSGIEFAMFNSLSADSAISTAANHFRRLSDQYPERYKPFLAYCLSQKSIYLSLNNKGREGIILLNESNDLFNNIADYQNQKYKDYRITNHLLLAMIQLDKSEIAEKNLTAASTLLNQTTDTLANSYRFLKSLYHVGSCFLHFSQADRSNARAALEQSKWGLISINLDFPPEKSLNNIIPDLESIPSIETRYEDPQYLFPGVLNLSQQVLVLQIQLHGLTNDSSLTKINKNIENAIRRGYAQFPKKYTALLGHSLFSIATQQFAAKEYEKSFALSDEASSLFNELLKEEHSADYQFAFALAQLNSSSLKLGYLQREKKKEELIRTGKAEVVSSIHLLKKIRHKGNVLIVNYNIKLAKKIKKGYRPINLSLNRWLNGAPKT
jgi:hypothetical protein